MVNRAATKMRRAGCTQETRALALTVVHKGTCSCAPVIAAAVALSLATTVACGARARPTNRDEWLAGIKVPGNHDPAMRDANLLEGLALHRTLSAHRAPDPYQVELDAERIRGRLRARAATSTRSSPRRSSTPASKHDDHVRDRRRRTRDDRGRRSPASTPIRAAREGPPTTLPLADGAPFDATRSTTPRRRRCSRSCATRATRMPASPPRCTGISIAASRVSQVAFELRPRAHFGEMNVRRACRGASRARRARRFAAARRRARYSPDAPSSRRATRCTACSGSRPCGSRRRRPRRRRQRWRCRRPGQQAQLDHGGDRQRGDRVRGHVDGDDPQAEPDRRRRGGGRGHRRSRPERSGRCEREHRHRAGRLSMSSSSRHEVKLGGGFGIDPSSYEVRSRAGYTIVGRRQGRSRRCRSICARRYARLRNPSSSDRGVQAACVRTRSSSAWTISACRDTPASSAPATTTTRSRRTRRTGRSRASASRRRSARERSSCGSAGSVGEDQFRRIDPLGHPGRSRWQLGLDGSQRDGAYEQSLIVDLRDNPLEPTHVA